MLFAFRDLGANFAFVGPRKKGRSVVFYFFMLECDVLWSLSVDLLIDLRSMQG